MGEYEMFKTTLMGGYDKDDVIQKVETIKDSAFWDCKNLTGNIPENLFVNNTEATNFANAFRSCSNLTGTPPPLWERQNITNSSLCFYGCNLLNLNEVPKSWGGNKKD